MKFFFFILMFCFVPAQRCPAASLSNSKGSDSKANEDYIFKNVYNSGLSTTQVLEILQRMKTVEQKLSEIESHKWTKGNCPPGWKAFNGSCYFAFIKPTVTWTDARDVCKSLGADLVKITSEAENTFAYGLISADLDVSVSHVWIGLHRGGDGNFYWVDGSSISYSGWDSGEPGSSEKCSAFYGSTSIPGKWHDLDCSNNAGYICEMAKAK